MLNKRYIKNKNRTQLETTPDPDVITESERIRNSDLQQLSKTEPFVISGLYKKFFNKKLQKFVAIRDLSFSVKTHECFGLLGLNGAGKTTAIKILTGEMRSDDGRAFVNGKELTAGQKCRELGFCPQFDYLPQDLTVKEVLQLYANLRGLEEWRVDLVVKEFMNIFKLVEFKDRLIINLR